MDFRSNVIFAVATVLLFWGLMGVIAPRLLRLPSAWFAGALAGYAAVGLFAAVEIAPAHGAGEGKFALLLIAWTLACVAVWAIRSVSRR